eukprot:TRINITY_DN6667_c0_g1_i1.p1 TRINITY_DN6667_c0_g1~~TRINITY_DN6667_c0_g1_i1.p1  ORF type:complete len:268 (+),score=73.52 TRINITY_DN6667_c0_g1_i1:1140-1943(+)
MKEKEKKIVKERKARSVFDELMNSDGEYEGNNNNNDGEYERNNNNNDNENNNNHIKRYRNNEESENEGSEEEYIPMETLLDSAVKKPVNSETPKKIQEMEQSIPVSSCEHKPSQNLTITKYEDGIPVYEESENSSQKILSSLVEPSKLFAKMIKKISTNVFGVSADKLALYINTQHRENTSKASVAFNIGGRLYFNLAFFSDVHFPKIKYGKRNLREAAFYWYITIAHEIAHNIESNHNQKHSYITQELESKYFSRLCGVLGFSDEA